MVKTPVIVSWKKEENDALTFCVLRMAALTRFLTCSSGWFCKMLFIHKITNNQPFEQVFKRKNHIKEHFFEAPLREVLGARHRTDEPIEKYSLAALNCNKINELVKK